MWLPLLIVASVTFTLASGFLLANVQVFFIPSPAMEPTLQVRDRILVDKLAYERHAVHRGDIVIFERPLADRGAIATLVKRAVAVGGDTIESRGDTLYVNEQPVDEPYVIKGSSIGGPVTRQTIPTGQVFLLGDNRTNSSDSRVTGPVDQDRIVGRVVLKIWPVGSFSRL